MRVIGVLDLLKGQAVHAQGGVRQKYAPVRAVGTVTIPPGDAGALARAYRDRFGIRELYVADLDALTGSALQTSLISELAETGPLWVDAGVSSLSAGQRVLALRP